MTKLERLSKTVKTEQEFLDAVNKSYWWYLDEPYMKTWTRHHLIKMFNKCNEKPIIKIELEIN